MFVMDTLYVPQQVNQIVLAQANTTSAPAAVTPQFDKTFTGCQDVGNVEFYAKSAFNSMALLPVVLKHLGYVWTGKDFNVTPEVNASIKSGVFAAPMHGKITLKSAINHGYAYEAAPGYVGKDKVVFWVEVSGRRFKIVQNLAVVDTILEGENGGQACDNMKFNMLPANMGPGLQAIGPIKLNLADMSSGVLGMTVGTNITLDTNAAGHNYMATTLPARWN